MFQTIDFFECASLNDLEDWSDEHQLETAGVAFREFVELTSNDESTDQEFEEALSEFEDKVKITWVNDTVSYTPLFLGLNEICNLDGEFKVGETVMKLVGNKIIIDLDPSYVDPSTLDAETETDTTSGIFVFDFLVNTRSGPCATLCQLHDGNAKYFSSSPRRKLEISYNVLYLPRIVRPILPPPHNNFLNSFTPTFLVQRNAANLRKRCYWLVDCDFYPTNSELSFDFTLTFSHDLGSFGMTNPIIVTDELGPDITSGFNLTRRITGTPTEIFSKFFPNPSICIANVDETLFNEDFDVNVHRECD